MTKDEIIEMAREAGISNYSDYRLESFAHRIGQIAAEKEREACAQYAENHDFGTWDGHDIAKAIRARKP